MTDQDQILDHLRQLFHEKDMLMNGMTDTPLHAFHKRSFETLQQARFPDKKHEDWRYTPVHRMMSPPYQIAGSFAGIPPQDIPGLDTLIIPVCNGKISTADLDPKLTACGIRILPLQKAFEDSSWINVFSSLTSAKTPDSNRAFELLNFSFHSHGFFLDIPPHLLLDTPIELRILHADVEPAFSHPLFFIRCGVGSRITLLERYDHTAALPGKTTEGMINAHGFIHLDQNADVRHIKWQDLPSDQHLVYKLIVQQMRDSRFESLAFDFGGAMVRNNVEVELEESNTYTSLQAGYIAKGTQSMDHQTRINHKVPHCESHEWYKGILDERATAAFNGKVYVHPDAQKTNAYQQNDTLILSAHAAMNSKPQLEIFADDVRCSHGATIGQLDPKALFYLLSRGIRREEATRMLKTAFLTAILETIPLEPISDFIKERMASAL